MNKKTRNKISKSLIGHICYTNPKRGENISKARKKGFKEGRIKSWNDGKITNYTITCKYCKKKFITNNKKRKYCNMLHTYEDRKLHPNSYILKMKNKTYEEIYGIEKAKEIRKKISKGNKGKIVSIEQRKKAGKSLKNHPCYKNPERSRKLRESTIKYKKENNILFSTIGKHEKEELDNWEKIIKYSIIRQYPIYGYFLDGYCKELNIAFEIDEKHHFDENGNLKDKDIVRQREIEKELNCSFIRIQNI